MGTIGNFYLVMLVIGLIIGIAVVAFDLSRKYWDKIEKNIEKRGGKKLNKWIRLAVVSFTGLLLATFALGALNTYSGQDAHAAHSGGGFNGSAVVGGMPMGQQVPQGYNPNSIEAQIYNMQVTMMQMQQQLNQINQMYMNQMNSQMPGGSMGGSGSMGGMSMM